MYGAEIDGHEETIMFIVYRAGGLWEPVKHTLSSNTLINNNI